MTIINNYEIIEKLGAGGMGTVYKAIDITTDTPVAIKQLKPDVVAANPEMLPRFKREGEILREVDHPNIVKMIDAFSEDGNEFIVMGYVSGGSLKDYLSINGPMPLETVLNIALEVADALTRAHHLNIIHRDIKPDNILLTEDLTPRLSDFGLARSISDLSITGQPTIMGTFYYMSPEVIQVRKLDARADIWAFGVVLYEMLTGLQPFNDETMRGLLTKILQEPPSPDLETLRPDIPESLIDLIHRMLIKDYQYRIPGTRLVGAELWSIASGYSIPRLHISEDTFSPGTQLLIDRRHHNLPEERTEIYGRDSELESLQELLEQSALITIQGPGGMGKTRLAIELGFLTLKNFEHGVFFVDLASISLPGEIIDQIAEAVGFQFYGDMPSDQQLMDYLQNKSLLLIMDNFEHLLEGVSIVDDILKSAPDVQIVATSRQRLQLRAEQVFEIEGIEYPGSVHDAQEFSAVQLFVDVARRNNLTFEVREEDLPAIADICHLVRGMPLGVILAAGWTNLIEPAEIAKEIRKNIDFLESDLSDLPVRQRSMRAAFDYSWRLLSDDERDVFSQLSVFRGGFTRQAASEVTGTSLRALLSLVNISLIHRSAEGRFSIHELLRQYGEEELTDSRVYERHAAYFADFLHQREDDIKGGRQIGALNEISAEIINIFAAWRWAADNRAIELLDRAAFTLREFLCIREHPGQAVPLFEHAIESINEPQNDREGILLGRLLMSKLKLSDRREVDQPQFESQLQRVFQLYDQHSAPESIVILTRQLLAEWGREVNPKVVLPHLQENIALAQALQDDWLLAKAYANLANFQRWHMIDPEVAIPYYEKSLTLNQKTGNIKDIGDAYFQLGMIFGESDPEKALTYYRPSHEMAILLGNKLGYALLEHMIGVAKFDLGHRNEAFNHILESLRVLGDIGHSWHGGVLDTYVLLLYRDGQLEEAKHILAQIDRSIWSSDSFEYRLMDIRYGFIEYATGNVEQAIKHFINAMSAHSSTGFGRTILVNAIIGLSKILVDEGHINTTLSYLFFTELQQTFDRYPEEVQDLIARLTEQLSDEEIEEARQRAANLDLETIVEALVARFGD